MTQHTLKALNKSTETEAFDWFSVCCASKVWATNMVNARPYNDQLSLVEVAKQQWSKTTKKDWLEAFEAHPMIGNVDSLREKFSNTKQIASNEQSGTASATDDELEALHSLNHDYKAKFGFIFIICATGLSTTMMLDALQIRVNNTREQELVNAAKEQLKIALLRINKALNHNEKTHEM